MKKQYSFVSKWMIKAPLEDAWTIIVESESWPEWWQSVKSVKEIEKGNEQGLGSLRVYRLSSPMKYRLCFSFRLMERSEFQLLKGEAYGDLEGTGAWFFSHKEGITYIECHWHVATTLRWMNVFSFFLAPLFRFNHASVMKQGAKALAKKLKAELLLS